MLVSALAVLSLQGAVTLRFAPVVGRTYEFEETVVEAIEVSDPKAWPTTTTETTYRVFVSGRKGTTYSLEWQRDAESAVRLNWPAAPPVEPKERRAKARVERTGRIRDIQGDREAITNGGWGTDAIGPLLPNATVGIGNAWVAIQDLQRASERIKLPKGDKPSGPVATTLRLSAADAKTATIDMACHWTYWPDPASIRDVFAVRQTGQATVELATGLIRTLTLDERRVSPTGFTVLIRRTLNRI